MAQRRAHRAARAARANPVLRSKRVPPEPAPPAAPARYGEAPEAATDGSAPSATALAVMACELIPLCTAAVGTEAFRSELLEQLRRARPDAEDRQLALALVQIRLQLIAYPPPAEPEPMSEA